MYIYMALINQIEDIKVVKEPQMVYLVSKKKEETEAVTFAFYKNTYFCNYNCNLSCNYFLKYVAVTSCAL